jgi:hypothetical protein
MFIEVRENESRGFDCLKKWILSFKSIPIMPKRQPYYRGQSLKQFWLEWSDKFTAWKDTSAASEYRRANVYQRREIKTAKWERAKKIFLNERARPNRQAAARNNPMAQIVKELARGGHYKGTRPGTSTLMYDAAAEYHRRYPFAGYAKPKTGLTRSEAAKRNLNPFARHVAATAAGHDYRGSKRGQLMYDAASTWTKQSRGYKPPRIRLTNPAPAKPRAHRPVKLKINNRATANKINTMTKTQLQDYVAMMERQGYQALKENPGPRKRAAPKEAPRKRAAVKEAWSGQIPQEVRNYARARGITGLDIHGQGWDDNIAF